MNRHLQNLSIASVFTLLVLGVLFSVVVETGKASAPDQATPSPNIATSSETPQPIVSVIVQPSKTNSVTYNEMLAAYKEVLETVKWIVITVVGVLTASSIGAVAIFQKFLQGSGEIQVELNKYKIELEDNRKQNDELKKSNEELARKIDEQKSLLESLRRNFETTKRQISIAKNDFAEHVPRLVVLSDIDTYAMKLFSTNDKDQQNAIKKIAEFSKDPDPIVRRESIRVFASMPSRSECFLDLKNPIVISRLKDLVLNDPERGIRLESHRILKEFGVDSSRLLKNSRGRKN